MALRTKRSGRWMLENELTDRLLQDKARNHRKILMEGSASISVEKTIRLSENLPAFSKDE